MMDFRNTKSIFLQIADNISERVVEGRYAPGDKIPSVRELAAEMGVNPNTVVRTFNELQSRGIIENKRGVGYFVGEDAPDLIRQWKKKEFFETDLPAFMHQVKLLGISFEELKEYFPSKINSDKHESK